MVLVKYLSIFLPLSEIFSAYKVFKYLICLISQTKVQYEPGKERMLLFGYFFVFLLMDQIAYVEHFPKRLHNKLGMGK